MIQKGMALRYTGDYPNEIVLAKKLGFDFFQIWFFNGSLSIATLKEPKASQVKAYGFPVIFHAVLDINDFEKHGQALVNLLDDFGHDEVIIHPVCTSEAITHQTVYGLERKLNSMYRELKKRGIKLYVENNSLIDGFFNSVEELSVVFDRNPDIGLLLDLAHINDYEHLRGIVRMRYPACIHIADKHLCVQHEHIALGKGDLDFKLIFKEIIPHYQGRVILEAVGTEAEIERSKQVMDDLFG